MKVFQYDRDGYFIKEEISSDGSLPHNCTTVEPEMIEGYWPRWTDNAWTQVENHKGEKGYVNREEFEIKEYGPYPSGWSTTPPPLTFEQTKENKLKEINEAKWREVDAGTVFNGIQINTDADAQRLANGAVTQCLLDPLYTCQWKLSDGQFITVNAEMITGVATAIRAHIQECFDREAALISQISMISTIQGIEAISWDKP